MSELFATPVQQKAIQDAHEVMGDGEIASCRKKVKMGCGICCNNGSALFRGETPETVPDGVLMIGRRIINCLGPKGCKFPNKQKPLICKLSPIINPGIAPNGQIFASIDLMNNCPAQITDKFKQKVLRVIQILMQAGIWIGESSYMGTLQREEMDEISFFLRPVEEEINL